MNVYLPYSKDKITQRFGFNANPLYASQGLKGHTAYDWGVSYGTDVPNCVPDSYCYSVLNKNNPDLSKYRAAYFLVESGSSVYEISYGHFSEILAEVGKTYQVGEIIGKVGNTGPVFVGSHQVTEAEKEAGSKLGAHLHGPQIRVLKRIDHYSGSSKDQYIYDQNGPLKHNGSFYIIPDYDNGYNGCVSLAPFSTEILATAQSKEAQYQKYVEIMNRTPENLPFRAKALAFLRAFIGLK